MKFVVLLSLLILNLASLPEAKAHKFSTAYMEVSAELRQPRLLWKVSLHDLAQAKLFGPQPLTQISWQQVITHKEELTLYIQKHIAFTDKLGSCSLAVADTSNWRTQQLQQQLYLLLPINATCQSPEQWQIGYQALFETGHNHKLLLSWQASDKAQAVLSKDKAIYPEY